MQVGYGKDDGQMWEKGDPVDGRTEADVSNFANKIIFFPLTLKRFMIDLPKFE